MLKCHHQALQQKRYMAKKKSKKSTPMPTTMDGLALIPPSKVEHAEHLARLQVVTACVCEAYNSLWAEELNVMMMMMMMALPRTI